MEQTAPQFVIVCEPGTEGAASPLLSCGSLEGVEHYAHARSGYFLNAQGYQALTVQTEAFDVKIGAQYFSLGLGVVVGCWVIAHSVGLVISSVKNA